MTALDSGMTIVMKCGELVLDGFGFKSAPDDASRLAVMVDIGQAEATMPADIDMILGLVRKADTYH
jgi:hypothetical protein